MQLLWHQPNARPRSTVIAHGVVTVGSHRAAARVHDAADDGDQRRFACAVGLKQREDFAVLDVKVDAF